jgi:hypothetical protein
MIQRQRVAVIGEENEIVKERRVGRAGDERLPRKQVRWLQCRDG